MKVSSLLSVPFLAGLATASVCKLTCTNLVQTPFSAWTDNFMAMSAPPDNNWIATGPCDNYDTCLMMTVDEDTALSMTTLTYPYTGTYTATLMYYVLDAGDGSGKISWGLSASDPGVKTDTATSSWQTYSIQFTATAGISQLQIAYSAVGSSTIQLADVQILACQ